MSQYLPIPAAVEDEWAFVFTEPNGFDFSDIQLVVPGGVYVYRPSRNLSE
jgi:hypothetical protein